MNGLKWHITSIIRRYISTSSLFLILSCITYVRPGAAGLLIGIECSRVRDIVWMNLTTFVISRIGVELAVVQGNYPSRL